jgi:DNA polymerase I
MEASTMTKKKRLLLIDGHALAYRAYHATPPMTAPDGEPTNATFGFANMLLKAIDDHDPDYVIATFDAGRTFRHDAYAEYKATRAKMPDDLRVQVERICELTELMGVPVHTKEGYEADDLLGTLSKKATEQGLETIIVTGDSDTFQLVDDSVRVLMPRRSLSDVQLYDKEAVRDRYGLEPTQLIDLKALMGDSSDNIPGVRGVGEKTATTLLQEYGDLDTVYEHLGEISQSRFRKALEAGRPEAELSRSLVTIECDLDVDLDLDAAVWGEFNRERLMELLRELGFHSLVGRLPGRGASDGGQLSLFNDAPAATADPVLGEYDVVDTADALRALAEELAQAGHFALDTETTGTDPMHARLVGLSVSAEAGRGAYVPVGHLVGQGTRQLDLPTVRRILGPVLADPSVTKVCHNAKFDLTVLDHHGLPVGGLTDDTMLAAWLLSPSGRGIGLREQAWQRLGVEMLDITELIGTGRNQKTMDQVSIERVANYASADADMTLRLRDLLLPELETHNQLELYRKLEMPLVPVLKAMEMRGIRVDTDYLQEMSRAIAKWIAEVEERIYAEVGHPFNLNSPKQLGEVLFDELGLPVQRRTKTGYSTDAQVLEQLRDKHPMVEMLLEYRTIDKLRSTYIDTLSLLVNKETGRVHTSFNQTGTSTGRLSSSDPNLQNIPVRTELGRQVRGAFVAPPGYLLLACDYSQVELRLLAHVAQDPEMMAAFRRDEDVHATTAATVFGVALDQVTYEQRSLAKAINFGLMYGMSQYGLASRTTLSIEEASQFIETYFQRFAAVKRYLEETIRFAQENGYVETIMGRRRLFPELQNRNTNQAVRRAAERAAINMPIQGSAADILKLAMIRLHDALQDATVDAHMILQVHDELVLEVAEADLDATAELVVDIMCSAYELDVPLKVDAAVGKNWMEMNPA